MRRAQKRVFRERAFPLAIQRDKLVRRPMERGTGILGAGIRVRVKSFGKYLVSSGPSWLSSGQRARRGGAPEARAFMTVSVSPKQR